jgi:hypothetical protein
MTRQQSSVVVATRLRRLRGGRRAAVALPTLGVVLLAMAGSAATGAPPSPAIFLDSKAPLRLYHEGWIDLDKNGVKDPYEDATLPIERRSGV